MAAKVILSTLKCQNIHKFWSVLQRNSLDFQNRSRARLLVARNASSWMISEKGAQEVPDEAQALGDVEPEEDESVVELKRDVSRLPTKMRNYLESSLRVPERLFEHEFAPKHGRKTYAHFGRASGVDPRVAWPSREELLEMKEFEQDWEPTLQERWAKLRLEKEEEMEKHRQHEENVEKAMAKMPKYIEQFKGRLGKEELAQQRQEEKRKAMMEEARDYFGYDIDPRDPRFKEMQEMKAEEEVKMKRKQRKEQKGLRMEASLERLKSETKKAESAS